MFDEKCFFIQAKSSQKSVKIVYFFGIYIQVSKLYTFLESTYPEMQRKLIPRVNEYQLSTSSHLVDDRYQISTRYSFGWRWMNQIKFWLKFDKKILYKQQSPVKKVSKLYTLFGIYIFFSNTNKKDKVQFKKSVKNVYLFENYIY